MVSIPGVTFIFASLDGRLDLSDNFDLPCSFSRFIQRYNVERAIPHRRAVLVTEPVSVYIPSHFWRIRIFRISSFMPRRYRLRFVYEKKNCSVSIDTLQLASTPSKSVVMARRKQRTGSPIFALPSCTTIRKHLQKWAEEAGLGRPLHFHPARPVFSLQDGGIYPHTPTVWTTCQDIPHTYIFSYCIAVCPIRSDTPAGSQTFRLPCCTISAQTHPHVL